MTTTLFALPAGHKKEKESASVPIADSRLRRVRLCAPAVCAGCGAPAAATGASTTAPTGAYGPMPGAAPSAAPQVSDKKKIVALLLAIFLGQLGIHNFYLGYTKKGIIQLCVSLLLSWTYVAPLAIWIWALVEGINAYQGKLPDADGRPLSD